MDPIGHGEDTYSSGDSVFRVGIKESRAGEGGTIAVRALVRAEGEPAGDLIYVYKLQRAIGARVRHVMSIKSLMTEPEKLGLGTLLMMIAAKSARFQKIPDMEVTGVAVTAQDFYERCGFSPSVEETRGRVNLVQQEMIDATNRGLSHNDKMKHMDDFRKAVFKSRASTWYGSTSDVESKCKGIEKKWCPCYTLS